MLILTLYKEAKGNSKKGRNILFAGHKEYGGDVNFSEVIAPFAVVLSDNIPIALNSLHPGLKQKKSLCMIDCWQRIS
ncbi:hypothetical protein [Nafulsella turpanensis]|uniref:hypothetical protein n=1 Tax=Nafulsella turpanensis TaxID=1265690 RepID=UPI00034A031E|nr:hypothetical protein [Nafulsella turpanensis]